MEKTIYELELHETLQVEHEVVKKSGISYKSYLYVTRVPGGWIYRRTTSEESGVFVPYSTEFKNTKPNDPRLVHNL